MMKWVSQAKRFMRIASVVSVGAIALAGCVTPIVASDAHFGVGVFVVETESLGHGCTRTAIRGIGFLSGYNCSSLGYVERVVIAAPAEGSYTLITPEVTFHVGEAAEELCVGVETKPGGECQE